MKSLRVLLFLLLLLPALAAPEGSPLWWRDNLDAWCIVPFDAKQRTPAQRAEMVVRLGLKKVAYDWREKHVPEFEEEILQYQKHGIEFFAFWDVHPRAFELFAKYKLHPQVWLMAPNPQAATNEEKIKLAATALLPAVEQTRKIGSRLALYNHGGWNGEPENMAGIAEYLRKHHDGGHVGIVYNFHHGHAHIETFAAKWKIMQPYLLAVNLNGMELGGDAKGRKILHLGEGDRELEMMRIIEQSGWRGPVGIIDHREETDSEVTLRNNLMGLDWLRKELVKPGSGGARPDFTAAVKPAPVTAELADGRFGKALNATRGGLLVPGKDAWRAAPITVEAWVKLRTSTAFNVVVASDTKASPRHWEMYSYARAGDFAVFLPGQGGEVRSGENICDDAWHHLAMVLEPLRVRLYVDGKPVQEKALPPVTAAAVQGELGIGRTVEPGIACDGLVDDVRISRGIREIKTPEAALTKDDATLELWPLDELVKTAGLPLDPAPLDPPAHPLHTHPLNRERLYDFYAKQARDYQTQPQKLLAAFPGLDGGRTGNWGNQTEDDWRQDRWNRMDTGPVQHGVFRHGGRTVPRAVCVRLGDMAACFDPDTLTWPVTWRGGFVRFGTARFGFLDGIAPAGEVLPEKASPPAKAGTFTYHGYYRHGTRIVFSYAREGVEWLESADRSDGNFLPVREPAGTGTLTALTKGGPAQWPQTFVTRGSPGEGAPYAIDTIPFPAETPWRSLWHFGDHDFFPNGDAALCTFEGEVWLVSGLDEKLERVTWRRFATGLHQPLGLRIVDGKVCVLGRDQITRLHDLTGDREADYYECLFRGYDTPSGGHDYVTGLQLDAAGRFYFASGKQGVMRAMPGGTLEILATGLRNPNGLAVGPAGEIAVAVQEGDWTPASMLYEFQPQPGIVPHFGHGGPKPGPLGNVPPVAYLPRAVDHSCGGQCYVEGDRWGVPAGTLVHFSWGQGAAFLVLREKNGDPAQGCVIPLPGDFRSGVHRGRFHPGDGQLYVTGTTGWITYTPDEGCFQRMRHTGSVQAPLATEARDNGVLLRFPAPLDPDMTHDAGRFFAQQWNYRYSASYGSDEYSVRHPGQRGHDALDVTSAHLLEDGRALFLEIPQMLPAHVLHLHCALPGLLTRDFYLTVHRTGPAFTAFPGYQVIAKMHLPAAQAAPAEPAPRAVKWEQGEPGRALVIRTAAALQFAQKELRATAGERLSLTLENPDAIPHNWVLVQRGAAERVGKLADQLVAAPDAAARHYVPDTPDVLCYTRLLNATQSGTIHFTAPSTPGRYPFLCTFPGHWMLMRGELIVE